MLNPTPQHAMQLVKTYPTGEEEWNCPQCGRRLLMEWHTQPPSRVLEPGDRLALHRCIKGDLSFGTIEVEDEGTTKLRRGPWGAWIDQLNLDE